MTSLISGIRTGCGRLAFISDVDVTLYESERGYWYCRNELVSGWLRPGQCITNSRAAVPARILQARRVKSMLQSYASHLVLLGCRNVVCWQWAGHLMSGNDVCRNLVRKSLWGAPKQVEMCWWQHDGFRIAGDPCRTKLKYLSADHERSVTDFRPAICKFPGIACWVQLWVIRLVHARWQVAATSISRASVIVVQ
jgi:hypothetical protein